ncbi:MAG: bacteriohemerythrin [Desulfuromonadales bacterium]|nr:bacteriohemerythrin [Desulfuromonadales bacterium]
MALQWTEDLAVGVGRIDAQHQEIFSKYNEFLDSCKSGQGRTSLLGLLDFLVDYVDEHFSHEEQLMAEYDYPDREQHIAMHRELTGIVLALRGRFIDEGPSLSMITELNRTIFEWLVTHIRKTDVELGNYLNRKWGLF